MHCFDLLQMNRLMVRHLRILQTFRNQSIERRQERMRLDDSLKRQDGHRSVQPLRSVEHLERKIHSKTFQYQSIPMHH